MLYRLQPINEKWTITLRKMASNTMASLHFKQFIASPSKIRSEVESAYDDFFFFFYLIHLKASTTSNTYNIDIIYDTFRYDDYWTLETRKIRWTLKMRPDKKVPTTIRTSRPVASDENCLRWQFIEISKNIYKVKLTQR